MKTRNAAALILLAGGAFFASTGVAFAADETTTCDVGMTEQVADDGTVTCVADVVATDEVNVTSEDGTCWTNEDGTNACARGGVLMGEPAPEPTTGCTDSTAPDGTTSTICYDSITPVNKTVSGEDTSETVLVSAPIMYSASGSAAPTGFDSNTLAALGVLVAALGAGSIGFLNNKQTK